MTTVIQPAARGWQKFGVPMNRVDKGLKRHRRSPLVVLEPELSRDRAINQPCTASYNHPLNPGTLHK